MWYLLILLAGIPILAYALILGTQKWYQDKLYLRDYGGPIDRNSAKYKHAIAYMGMAAGGGIVLGGLMIIYALANLGLLD